MALSASIVWEVQSTASDSNGGGFVVGASGTDFSQQTSAQYTFTDLVVDAVTNTKVQSASHNFVASDVGNIMQITAGASWTTGFYQIVSVAANQATLDRSPGAVGITGGTFAVGGALASPGKAGGAMVAGNVISIKATATYSITSASLNVAGGCISMPAQAATANAARIIGYGTTRGDLGRPTLQASGISSFTIILVANGNSVENLIIDGASLTSSRAINAANGRVNNCKVMNCTNTGCIAASGIVVNCEATGCSGGGAAGFLSASVAIGCTSHNNTGSAAGFLGTGVYINCIAWANSGAGFFDNAAVSRYENCTSYGNTGDGFKVSLTFGSVATEHRNLISFGNTGWGVNAGTNPAAFFSNIFLGTNTAGAVTGSPTITGQVNLSVDPFTNAAGQDFSLNNTGGGGAAVRAAGLPGVFPGASTTGYLDGGAAQHQDTGGGAAGMLFVPNLDGV